jgi:hypothetical protein
VAPESGINLFGRPALMAQKARNLTSAGALGKMKEPIGTTRMWRNWQTR